MCIAKYDDYNENVTTYLVFVFHFFFLIIIVNDFNITYSSLYDPLMRVYDVCVRACSTLRRNCEMRTHTRIPSTEIRLEHHGFYYYFFSFFPNRRQCHLYWNMPNSTPIRRPLLHTLLLTPPSRVIPHSEFSEYTRNLSKQPCGVSCVLYYNYIIIINIMFATPL